MKYASKIDANQENIVEALLAVGCSVQSLAAVGDGCPDLLVSRQGVNYLLEVKSDVAVPSKRRLTPAQQKWHAAWRGQVAIVMSREEAMEAIGVKGFPK